MISTLAREFLDLTFGHGCFAQTPCTTELANQTVFVNGLRALTVGAVFAPHSCAGLDVHAPVATPSTGSTRIFIRNIQAVTTYKPMSCGDVIINSITFPPRLFVGI